MTEKEIRFKIWALLQDNLRRGDILERSKSEEHKQTIRQNIKEAEEEIAQLKELLRRN